MLLKKKGIIFIITDASNMEKEELSFSQGVTSNSFDLFVKKRTDIDFEE